MASYQLAGLTRHGADTVRKSSAAFIPATPMPYRSFVPGVSDRVVTSVGNASMAAGRQSKTTVQLPHGVGQGLGDIIVKGTLVNNTAGSEAFSAFVGLNAIARVKLLAGSTTLCEWNSFPAAYRAAILMAAEHQGRSRADAMLDAAGPAAPSGGADVDFALIMPVPWASIFRGAGSYLPTEGATEQLRLELTFENNASEVFGDGTTDVAPTIANVEVVTRHVVLGTAATESVAAASIGKDILFSPFDIQTCTEATDVGGSAVSGYNLDVTGLVGIISSFALFSASGAAFEDGGANAISFGAEGVTLDSIVADGKTLFEHGADDSEARLLGAVYGHQEDLDSAADCHLTRWAHLSLDPTSDAFTGGLSVSEARSLNLRISAPADTNVLWVGVGPVTYNLSSAGKFDVFRG